MYNYKIKILLFCYCQLEKFSSLQISIKCEGINILGKTFDIFRQIFGDDKFPPFFALGLVEKREETNHHLKLF